MRRGGAIGWIVGLGLVTVSRRVEAGTMPPPPSPAPSPPAAGQCARPALASIAIRPGLGRAPATSGAVCVATPGAVVIGAGFRNQTTAGAGRQHLEVYPAPVALIGVAERLEVIVAPGLIFSQRSGTNGSAFAPAHGQQDAGAGAQYLLSDRPAFQQALALFTTFPTGYPVGPSGFSVGSPASALSYTAAIALSSSIGFSTSQAIVVASGFNALGGVERFRAYQPTFNVSYALAPPTTLLLEDQITTPGGAGAPTGNRALLGVQQTVSPNVVLDAEFEVNLLPSPGFDQHALGGGLTIRF